MVLDNSVKNADPVEAARNAALLRKWKEVYSFEPGSIGHQLQPEGGRGLSTYEAQLLFDREQLRGKKILDLGAGPELKFARDLKDVGIEADVCSLSPDFADEKYLEKARESFPGAKLVVGIGQELPFEDESFDYVLAFHIDEHLNIRQFLSVIGEISRVLKKGGQARYGPTNDIPGEWDAMEEILGDKSLMDELKNRDEEVTKEFIPETVFKRMKVKDYYGNAFYGIPSFDLVITRRDKTSHEA